MQEIPDPGHKSKLVIFHNMEMIARDKYGKIIWRRAFKNQVLDAGRNIVVRMLGEGIQNPITFMAWGDGGHNVYNPAENIPVERTDTQLVHEIFRKTISTFAYTTPTSIRFIGILEPHEIVGAGLSEQGLFHYDGTIFARLTYPLLYKGNVQIEFRWTIMT